MRRLMILCKHRKSLECFANRVSVRSLTTQSPILRKKIKKNETELPENSPKATEALIKFPFLRVKRNSSDGLYTLHDHIAEIIINHLGTNLKDENVTIIEANPGPAVLTTALLNAGATKLKVIEFKEAFFKNLYELQKSVTPDRLQVVEADFFNLSKIAYRDKHVITSVVDKMFEGVQARSWDDSIPPCVIIGTVPPARENYFLPYLSVAITERIVMYTLGRAQLLLFVTDKRLKNLTSKPNQDRRFYRTHSILSQICFDIELLHKEQRSNFYPHPRNILKNAQFDQEHLYLIKMTPKDTLLNMITSPASLKELYFFVKHTSHRKSDFVIAKLETWIANCGVQLIKNGFSIFTQFGDLTPNQYLNLFLEFTALPDYPDCSFKTVLQRSRQEYDDS